MGEGLSFGYGRLEVVSVLFSFAAAVILHRWDSGVQFHDTQQTRAVQINRIGIAGYHEAGGG